jgi:diadenosine tetraphosphatase ApaH/serine/threonine PP2A family protein phosphatase
MRTVSGMKIALFSDIHSNLEALEAVLADIHSQHADRLVCLGDIVGYAADPGLCLERVRGLHCPVVQGNHDCDVSSSKSLRLYNPLARAGMEHSRTVLSVEQKRFLSFLPKTLRVEGLEMVHASLHDPAEFLYVMTSLDATFHFECQHEPVAFCGHTHNPVVWEDAPDECIDHRVETFTLDPAKRYLVNIGSVGQPRDRDPRACYVIYDTRARTVVFRRVVYDILAACEKIDRAGLPAALGERLLLGM